MRFIDLANQDLELVEKAKGLIRKRKSERSTVAAVLRTGNGKVFYGLNIEVKGSSPCSICAEYTAIGTMVSEGESEIETIVAISQKNEDIILPPCGKCRQLIREFGNPYMIVQVNHELKKVKLSELLPSPSS